LATLAARRIQLARLYVPARVGIIALWAGIVWQALSFEAGRPSDFAMYYAAAQVLHLGLPGASIYSHAQLVQIQAHACPLLPFSDYLYPPFLAVAMEPLTWLRCETAQQLWMLFNAGLWLTSAIFMAREVRTLFQSEGAYTVALLLTLFCFPAWWGFALGQITFVLLLGFVGLPWLARRHPRWAGVVLALFIWIKLYPAILLVWLISNRRWSAVKATVIAFAAIGLGVLLVVGLPGLLAYRSGVAAGFGYTSAAHNEAPSRALVWLALMVGTHLPATIAGWSASILLALVGGAYALLVWQLRGSTSEQKETAGYAAALCVMLLLSPVIWAHYWVWLLPALLAYLRSFPSGWKLALGCAILTCIPLPFYTDTRGLMVAADAHGLAGSVAVRAFLLLVRALPVCILFVASARSGVNRSQAEPFAVEAARAVEAV
jgi:hypothetical protein